MVEEDPYLRLVSRRVVDVGISEHTESVCDASRRAIPDKRTSFFAAADAVCGCTSLFETGAIEMVKGLGTVIYHVPDVNRAKAWYSTAFQQQPYFDQPFYVGFNIGGYELGLDPNPKAGAPGRGGSVAYWRVDEIDRAVRHFVDAGAGVLSPSQDVGDGIKVATVADPFGNPIGLIENPHFKLPGR